MEEKICKHCGCSEFETWTELEYSDCSEEPNTSNYLVKVEYNECKNCGEIK